MPSKFSQRAQEEEIMDDLNCSGEVVNQTLRELEIINRRLGGNQVTLSGLFELIKDFDKQKTIRIADLGCGGGDILKLIHVWGMREKYKFELWGIDANPNIIAFAKENIGESPSIRFAAVDIFSGEFKRQNFDIAIGTLFFHHFSSDRLIEFFRQLYQQATIGIVINDLHRHWLAYFSIKVLTTLFSRSAMVKFDAPLSVLRAFSRKELIEILDKAGIGNYAIHWKWAFRWQIVIKKGS